MLKSTAFRMNKGDNASAFRVLCGVARLYVAQGDTLKIEGFADTIGAWNAIRPIDFARKMAAKDGFDIPAHIAGYFGGNLCATHLPAEYAYLAKYAGLAEQFRYTVQTLRMAVRAHAMHGQGMPEHVRSGILTFSARITEEFGATE